MSARGWTLLAVALAAIVAINVFGGSDRRPHGPTSSSYATAPAGVAAYAELLERSGYRIRRERTSVEDQAPDASDTLVVLDPGRLTRDETRALTQFARRGGRLVAGGDGTADLAAALRGGVHATSDGPERWTPGAPLPGVRVIRTAGDRIFDAFDRALPLLVADGAAALVELRPGRGEVVLLADVSPLQNRLLAAADNAPLGLALAGPRERRVVFLESVHGYDEQRGLSALPSRWKAALVLAAIAALLFMLARARRFGDPEPAARTLDPARREHVEAVAASLARTPDRTTTAVVLREAARRALAQRAALGPDPDDDDLRAAAEAAALTPEEVAAVVADDRDLIATGRALARLTDSEDPR